MNSTLVAYMALIVFFLVCTEMFIARGDYVRAWRSIKVTSIFMFWMLVALIVAYADSARLT